jgi:hypothetical protein
MMDFPKVPKDHAHERIHRSMFMPNRIDVDPAVLAKKAEDAAAAEKEE